MPQCFQCSPVPVYNIVKQQQLYFRDDGFPINVVVQRIVTNRLIEKAKKNGQSGLFSADKLPFHDFHCCCCYSYWCLFNYKITIIILQFATQDSDVLFFFFSFFFSRKLQDLPNNLLHTT